MYAGKCDLTCGFCGTDFTSALAIPQELLSLYTLEDDAASLAMCYTAPMCNEFIPPQNEAVPGVVVQSGCHQGGQLGDECVLTCQEGYESKWWTAGTCTLSDDLLSASYIGQAVTCEPERLPTGELSQEYCVIAAEELITRHCCDDDAEGECDAQSNVPTTCGMQCAEDFLQLWGECEANLGVYQGLATVCEQEAETFLSAAPVRDPVAPCLPLRPPLCTRVNRLHTHSYPLVTSSLPPPDLFLSPPPCLAKDSRCRSCTRDLF